MPNPETGAWHQHLPAERQARFRALAPCVMGLHTAKAHGKVWRDAHLRGNLRALLELGYRTTSNTRSRTTRVTSTAVE